MLNRVEVWLNSNKNYYLVLLDTFYDNILKIFQVIKFLRTLNYMRYKKNYNYYEFISNI
jgi:hypothetical protein